MPGRPNIGRSTPTAAPSQSQPVQQQPVKQKGSFSSDVDMEDFAGPAMGAVGVLALGAAAFIWGDDALRVAQNSDWSQINSWGGTMLSGSKGFENNFVSVGSGSLNATPSIFMPGPSDQMYYNFNTSNRDMVLSDEIQFDRLIEDMTVDRHNSDTGSVIFQMAPATYMDPGDEPEDWLNGVRGDLDRFIARVDLTPREMETALATILSTAEPNDRERLRNTIIPVIEEYQNQGHPAFENIDTRSGGYLDQLAQEIRSGSASAFEVNGGALSFNSSNLHVLFQPDTTELVSHLDRLGVPLEASIAISTNLAVLEKRGETLGLDPVESRLFAGAALLGVEDTSAAEQIIAQRFISSLRYGEYQTEESNIAEVESGRVSAEDAVRIYTSDDYTNYNLPQDMIRSALGLYSIASERAPVTFTPNVINQADYTMNFNDAIQRMERASDFLDRFDSSFRPEVAAISTSFQRDIFREFRNGKDVDWNGLSEYFNYAAEQSGSGTLALIGHFAAVAGGEARLGQGGPELNEVMPYNPSNPREETRIANLESAVLMEQAERLENAPLPSDPDKARIYERANRSLATSLTRAGYIADPSRIQAIALERR